MKIHNTQRLFWKQWPIKVVLAIEPELGKSPNWRLDADGRREREREFGTIQKWCKLNFPDSGIRRESNLSLFLENEEQLDTLLETYGHKVMEVWRPESKQTQELLKEHTYDIVRERPWYGKFGIRARINFNNEFKVKHLATFKTAVNAMNPDDWHAAGMLKDLIEKTDTKNRYGWGQPLHLYLASNDDAIMLKLQCGSSIERFERVRKPV